MAGPLDVLDGITIASPCPIAWDQIGGGGRVRFCQTCQKNVFDVIEMTTVEAAAIFSDDQALPCVRLCHDSDGRIVTADRAPGVRGRIWRRLRLHAPWAASLFAMLFFSGC